MEDYEKLWMSVRYLALGLYKIEGNFKRLCEVLHNTGLIDYNSQENNPDDTSQNIGEEGDNDNGNYSIN